MDALADRLVATCAHGGKHVQPGFANPADRVRIGRWLRESIQASRRFILDDEVTLAGVTLGIQHPDLLLQMLRRARTPFGRIWMEWSVAPQLEAAGERRSPNAADRAGVLVEQLGDDGNLFRLTEAAMTTDGTRDACVLPFSVVYDIRDPIPVPDPTDFEGVLLRGSGLDRGTLRRVLLGSAYISKEGATAPPDRAEVETRRRQCDALAAHAAFEPTPIVGDVFRSFLEGRYRFEVVDDPIATYDAYRGPVRDSVRFQVLEFAGVWRIVVSMLALLQDTRFVASDGTYRAGRNRVVRGKLVPFLAYQVARLRLPREIVERQMVRSLGESLSSARVDVMGHWAESRRRGDPDCDHVHVEETIARDACVLCGHKRWWVRDHKRRKSGYGEVTTYRVLTLR